MITRKRLTILVVLFAVAAGGVYGLSTLSTAGHSDSFPTDVDERVLASDIIVTAEDITDAGEVFVEAANRTVESWSVVVTGLHHHRQGPAFAVGDRIVVGAETDSFGERQHLLETGSGPYVLGLRYVPLEDSNGYQDVWVMRFVATQADGESAAFLHSTNGSRWTTQLAGVARASNRSGDAEFLAEWASEADSGPASGPIQTLFENLQASPSEP